MYLTTTKESDTFTLINDDGQTIGTIEVRRRRGQFQLGFNLPNITIRKQSQDEVKNDRLSATLGK
jgi:Holliday junction resolvase-like predicted endonuclease